jgi:CBS domain-containing protein
MGDFVMLRTIESFMKPKVHQLPPDATVYQAAHLMTQKNCAAVVVSAKGRLEGIFTSGDLVKRVAAAKRDPAKTKLADVMTSQPETVKPGTLAIDALRMMQDGRYRHLPVIDRDHIVGIVSRRDFFGQEQVIVEDEDRLSETMR